MGDRCCQCFNGQSVDPDRFTDTLRALHGELVLEMREAFKEFGVFNTAFFDSLDVIHNVCEVGVVFLFHSLATQQPAERRIRAR